MQSLGSSRWLRDGLLLAAAVALGWYSHGWARNVRPVQAASGDLQFQLTPSDSLLIYSPNDRTIYVYKGASGGNSAMQCSYSYFISGGGSPVDRRSCDMGRLTR